MAAPAAAARPTGAAGLIGASLERLIKLSGRDKKLSQVAEAAKELNDKLAEVLSPEYAARTDTGLLSAQAARRTAEAAAAAADAEGAGDDGGEDRPESAGAGSQQQQQQQQRPATPEGGGIVVASAAAEAEAAAAEAEQRAAEARRDADKARLAAAAASLPFPAGGGPSGGPGAATPPLQAGALSDAAALAVLRVLRLAVATSRPPLVEVALDLIHKLIALRLLQGAAYSVAADRQGAASGGGAAAAGGGGGKAADLLAQTPQAVAVELMCRCDEIPDEGVEVLVLRGLLTATTSTTFTLHGQALLLAIRTCYNIHLMSRSEVNQTTAKASLTQALNVVFQRMEAGSVLVAVRPIAVADMLSTAGGRAGGAGAAPPPPDAMGIAPAVQGFLNGVVSMTGYGGSSAQQQAEALRSSVAAQFTTEGGGGGGSPVLGPQPPPLPPPGLALGGPPDAKPSDSSQQQQQGAAATPAGASPRSSDMSDGEGGSPGASGAFALPVAVGGAVVAAAGGAGSGDAQDLLLRDAFLVFRSLCKLSIRTSDSATVMDPTAVRGKLLALELLKVLLENSGPKFRGSDRFTSAIRQYLCLSLLKNSASSLPAALQLSASIFLSLLLRFRASLKAEVGAFFPMLYLRALEPPGGPGGGGGGGAGAAAAQAGGPAVNSYTYKVFVLRCLREVCADGRLLVDLFVNYDCDLGSSNIFERLVNALVKMAQAPLPQGGDHTALQQEQWLRQEALQCLASAAEGLLQWYNAAADAQLRGGDEGSEDEEQQQLPRDGSATPTRGPAAALAAAAEPGLTGGPEPRDSSVGGAGAAGDALSRKRAMKGKWHEGVALFNKKPKKGIAFLQAEGMLGPTPEDVAAFLSKTEGLDKTTIGDYLGEREDTALKVMHAYVDALDFVGLEFDTAIRAFLQGFRLPGEAQKIDRLMEKFAARFIACNPGSFKSADVAYVLAYSVIMLNTDAHNPQVKNKMTCDGFIRNNRGINDGQDLPPDFMKALYERIVTNEIKMKDEGAPAAGGAPDAGGAVALLRANAVMAALMSIVGGSRPHASNEPSDEAIKRTLDSLHERARGATFVVAKEPDTVRPMLELIWAPLLGAFSLLFEEYSDPRRAAVPGTAALHCFWGWIAYQYPRVLQRGASLLLQSLVNNPFSSKQPPQTRPLPQTKHPTTRLLSICLSGFAAAACLSTSLGVDSLRDVFVTSLCNFTGLHSPSSMKPKNGAAFRALLRVAVTVGDGLEGRWLDVLRCISRWELLQQMASGMPTDAALFAGAQGGPEKGVVTGIGGRAAAALKDQLRKLGGPGTPGGAATTPHAYDEGVKSMETLAMSEASVKRAGAQGGRDDDAAVPLEVISSVDVSDIQQVFLSSSRLDSDAVVAFVRALAAISLDELRDPRAPRVFSLTKIVEAAHFNMGRIRLVWSRIWAVLSEYFIAVGCHGNLAVAMYAVDSLRQLSMKFLERDELANYTFQNDFLRPFVVVMRQSQSVEIRELIIRCLSQMVLARVDNIKSGWKSMFMVFTTAAGDPDPTIVRLAFDTVERIVRGHFEAITETEAATFTDAVNCLVAFTNNQHSLDVALNGIAFLRFCAMRLAEGLPTTPAGGAGSAAALRSSGGGGVPPPAAAGQQGGASGAGVGGFSGGLHAPGAGSPDEAVYYWFPLLAGLSELTFDPRREVRYGALEVLFDTLRFHGGAFSEAFWCRVFERVLLPIFDAVRAEVTDTTTFSTERRRQQEDAWLYETCTRCLQHLVDLFGQFYPAVRPMLPRLLALLGGFMARSHAALASVGVAAFARLAAACGPSMDAATWGEVVGTLQGVVGATLPDAAGLVTPPSQSAGGSSGGDLMLSPTARGTSGGGAPPAATQQQQAAGQQQQQQQQEQGGASSGGAGTPRPPYTLREGVGARRLARFRVHSGVQLLLVQTMGDIYARGHGRMPPSVVLQLVEALAAVADHARAVNTDAALRRQLVARQAEDRVPEDRCVPDPPLLRQETEACHSQLSLLLHLAGGGGSKEAARTCGAQQRLEQLTLAVLERFSGTAAAAQQAHVAAAQPPLKGAAAPPLPSGPAGAELASFAPLVVSTLKAIAACEEGAFKRQLPGLFPALAQLVRCDHATPDVQRALSDLLLGRVGPLLGADGNTAGLVGLAAGFSK